MTAGASRISGLPSITVGLWMVELSGASHRPYNQCDIYGPLRAICPEFSRFRAVSGLERASAEDWRELGENASVIADEINQLLTRDALDRAFTAGRFDGCLIRKESRAILDLSWSPEL